MLIKREYLEYATYDDIKTGNSKQCDDFDAECDFCEINLSDFIDNDAIIYDDMLLKHKINQNGWCHLNTKDLKNIATQFEETNRGLATILRNTKSLTLCKRCFEDWKKSTGVIL